MPAKERKMPPPEAYEENTTVENESTANQIEEYDPNVPEEARSPQPDTVYGDSSTGQLDDDTALRNAIENHS